MCPDERPCCSAAAAVLIIVIAGCNPSHTPPGHIPPAPVTGQAPQPPELP